uniref:Kinesin-like protein n=2 Tax=Sarcoptes scabiei TaxID=52283 RepID=A0A834RCS1_SARSC
MENLSAKQSTMFAETCKDFNLPKVSVSTKSNPESGREVNLNLKNNGSKKQPSSNNSTPNKGLSNGSSNFNSCSRVKRGLNFELSCLNPKSSINKVVKETPETSKNIEMKKESSLNKGLQKNNGAKFALNLNFQLNVTDEKTYQDENRNLVSLSSSMDNLNSSKSIDHPSSVKVAVRMRPLSETEKTQQKDKKPDILIKDGKVMVPSKKELFEFDQCFDSSNPELFNFASQELVYRKMAQPLLESAFQGYNICLFAYGQSGSGKTYTMMGPEDNPGITPRFLNDLFRRVSNSSNIDFIVNVSFMEIYNEKIFDLLSDEFESFSKKLRVREHPQTGPYVEDLTIVTVETYEEAMNLLRTGLIRRSTAATESNEQSSRSHLIFSVLLVQNKILENDENSQTSCISKINLVDLAGSERVGINNSDRFREGTMINKSLLSLGKVITQLAENSNQNNSNLNHISYRESVLTYLLKDSLGGNSRTSMIATISPAKNLSDETISTLRYASIAQKIVNIVHVNEDPKMRYINGLLKQISFLKKEVNRSQENGVSSSGENSNLTNISTSFFDENDVQIVIELKNKFKSAVEQQRKILNELENLEKSPEDINPDEKINKFRHKILDDLKNVLKSSEEQKPKLEAFLPSQKSLKIDDILENKNSRSEDEISAKQSNTTDENAEDKVTKTESENDCHNLKIDMNSLKEESASSLSEDKLIDSGSLKQVDLESHIEESELSKSEDKLIDSGSSKQVEQVESHIEESESNKSEDKSVDLDGLKQTEMQNSDEEASDSCPTQTTDFVEKKSKILSKKEKRKAKKQEQNNLDSKNIDAKEKQDYKTKDFKECTGRKGKKR